MLEYRFKRHVFLIQRQRLQFKYKGYLTQHFCLLTQLDQVIILIHIIFFITHIQYCAQCTRILPYSLLLSFACCLSFCASSWLEWRDMPKFCCVITTCYWTQLLAVNCRMFYNSWGITAKHFQMY